MSEVAVISKADSVARWYIDKYDIKRIYNKMLQLTDNDMEISDEAACWCGDAPLGAHYTFREGWIDIQEV